MWTSPTTRYYKVLQKSYPSRTSLVIPNLTRHCAPPPLVLTMESPPPTAAYNRLCKSIRTYASSGHLWLITSQIPVNGQKPKKHIYTNGYECRSCYAAWVPFGALCVGISFTVRAPHLDLRVGKLRMVHSTFTFEFPKGQTSFKSCRNRWKPPRRYKRYLLVTEKLNKAIGT